MTPKLPNRQRLTTREVVRMFLHLGSDVVVLKERVIGIFNLEISGSAQSTRDFLALARAEGRLIEITENDAEGKSVVVTDRVVYISPISALTLQKRAQ